MSKFQLNLVKLQEPVKSVSFTLTNVLIFLYTKKDNKQPDNLQQFCLCRLHQYVFYIFLLFFQNNISRAKIVSLNLHPQSSLSFALKKLILPDSHFHKLTIPLLSLHRLQQRASTEKSVSLIDQFSHSLKIATWLCTSVAKKDFFKYH